MSHAVPRRRTAVLGLAFVATAALLAGCSATPAPTATLEPGEKASGTLVVSTFPFGVEEFQQAIVDPFEEATGITVELDTGSNADRLSKLELNGGNSGIDVMLISDYYAALGQSKDLFAEVDEEQVPTLAEISDFAKEDQYDGPAYSYQLNGTLYRTDQMSAEQAADWESFGDPTFAGKIAMPDISVTAGQLTVSGIADVFGDDPYDVDEAFSTMASWSDNVLQYYTSSTEVSSLLSQGEIAAAPALSGFATSLVASGAPIAWTAPEEGKFMATNRAMIPQGAPNTPAANAFIDYLLSVEAQTSSASIVGDLPVNPGATVPDELTGIVGLAATDPIGDGYRTLDIDTIASNRSSWVDRFAREVSSR
jgi:putative spermidine/putrescine transport system substrate-binding protein